MSLTITVQIASCGGPNSGPFDLYWDLVRPSRLLASNITCEELLSGYVLTNVPDTTTAIILNGIGTCTDVFTIPLVSPTPTPTASSNIDCTVVFDITPNISPTISPSPTRTPIKTPTITPTTTPTSTVTPTWTPTNTLTPTNTPTKTSTPTNTPTNTATPTRTPLATPKPTTTQTPTNTETPTQTPSNTPTNTQTPANTPSNTPTSTNTPTNTPTTTVTPTTTPTPTLTQTPSRTPLPSRTQTPTSTATPTNTPTLSSTNTPTPTPTSTVVAHVYYGINTTGILPTESQIQSSSSSTADPLTDVTVDWSALTPVPVYCWVAIQNYGSTDLKNYWYVNSINNGAIGGTSNLFTTRTQITVGGRVFNVYITNYQTQFVSTCTLKNTL